MIMTYYNCQMLVGIDIFTYIIKIISLEFYNAIIIIVNLVPLLYGVYSVFIFFIKILLL